MEVSPLHVPDLKLTESRLRALYCRLSLSYREIMEFSGWKRDRLKQKIRDWRLDRLGGRYITDQDLAHRAAALAIARMESEGRRTSADDALNLLRERVLRGYVSWARIDQIGDAVDPLPLLADEIIRALRTDGDLSDGKLRILWSAARCSAREIVELAGLARPTVDAAVERYRGRGDERRIGDEVDGVAHKSRLDPLGNQSAEACGAIARGRFRTVLTMAQSIPWGRLEALSDHKLALLVGRATLRPLAMQLDALASIDVNSSKPVPIQCPRPACE
jgi:hypothetical protein